MQDLIGRTLGHYRIVEKIGEGGMGVVYRAHDERLDRDVAIKVLPEAVAGDPDRLRRFEREAKAVAALSHPNILEIHDFDTEDDVTYAVTELLEGKTLREHLRKLGGPLPSRQVQEIGAAVAKGLGAAHSKGVVHRDIKPSNIFLCSDGRVKILDFGLAATHEMVESESETGSLEAPLTRNGSVMGTVGYMAPEQVRGEPADHRSDIFALGCVLYEMLTGERAFKRDTTPEIMTAILREEPRPFSESGVQVAPEVAKAVQHCLEKPPERRFQSAADVAFALGSGADITVSPWVTSETPRLRAWAMPLLAITGILLVAVAMVFGPRILERLGGRSGQPSIRSIAILPLENLTGDPEQAYFVDGLHEELIATFAQISGFEKVIARTSVMGFRDSDTPIREIGKQLDVDAVLEGSVRRSGDTVRATVQLIDARTESHLWAENYDRNLKDILTLQSEVAQEVVGEVRVTLTLEEENRLAGARPVDKKVYEAHLKGAHLLSLGPAVPEETLTKAIGFFEMAILEDPTFAPAHVGLSQALIALAFRYRPPREVMPQALEAALTAVELDDDQADAHAVLGRVKTLWEWDWPGADSEFMRALELGPNDPDTVSAYSHFLPCMGRSEKAVVLQERAVELDPLNPIVLRQLGWVYHVSRRYDDAIGHLLKTVELYPNRVYPHLYLSWNYLANGLYAEAAAEFERAGELHAAPDRDPFHLMFAPWVYTALGRHDEADAALQRLLELQEQTYVPSSLVAMAYMAMAYIGIEDADRTIEWLQRAYDERDMQLPFIKALPCFDALRDDPRFQAIVKKMNFPAN